MRKQEDLANREKVEEHFDLVTRIAFQHTLGPSTSEVHLGTLDELLQIIQKQTAHLGITSATTYITPDGKTKWQWGMIVYQHLRWCISLAMEIGGRS